MAGSEPSPTLKELRCHMVHEPAALPAVPHVSPGNMLQ